MLKEVTRDVSMYRCQVPLVVIPFCKACVTNNAGESLKTQVRVADVLIQVSLFSETSFTMGALEFTCALLHDELVPPEPMSPSKLRTAVVAGVWPSICARAWGRAAWRNRRS
jgi:hypothetical protein